MNLARDASGDEEGLGEREAVDWRGVGPERADNRRLLRV